MASVVSCLHSLPIHVLKCSVYLSKLSQYLFDNVPFGYVKYRQNVNTCFLDTVRFKVDAYPAIYKLCYYVKIDTLVQLISITKPTHARIHLPYSTNLMANYKGLWGKLPPPLFTE